MVEIGAQSELGSEIEIGPGTSEDGAGIVEVRLALFLRRAERIEDSVAAIDRDRTAAPGERNGLSDPVAGVGAGEDRVLEDRVKAAFPIVERIAVAAREQEGAPEAHPVEIVARL